MEDLERMREMLREENRQKSKDGNKFQTSSQKRDVNFRPTYQPTFRPVGGNKPQPKPKSAGPSQLFHIAIAIYEWINEMFKSFGIVAGGIATSVADWVFGAVTMTVLLSNYTGFSVPMKWIAGGVFSLALWGIQIIMWRLVLDGKIAKVAKDNRKYLIGLYALVFLVIFAMKLGDDFSDIIGVFWLIKDNPMQFTFSADIYKWVLNVIFFLTWCICGFAEVFVALSINLLKDSAKKQDWQK